MNAVEEEVECSEEDSSKLAGRKYLHMMLVVFVCLFVFCFFVFVCL